MPPRKLENMTPEQIEENVDKLSPAWAKDYIRRLEGLTRALAAQLQAAQQSVTGVTEIADHAREELRQAAGSSGRPEPSVWTPAGITAPDGDYSTVRVLDPSADKTPVADINQQFIIRFADFYQVRYGAHDTTGGMRLLVVQGDGPVVIHPIGQDTVLISRGGYTQESR